MTRRRRDDDPGTWHHVMNRGVARRSMFENRADARFFLAQVARAVRRGEIEVHAWCVMTTHFHLLVRSPRGALSRAMQRIQNAYVRHFNRRRVRDGPLVRGRYKSKIVRSLTYRAVLVRYIDNNPVAARLCTRPEEYELGSAWHYSREKGPPWMTRGWVESWAAGIAGTPAFEPGCYPGPLDATAWQRADDLVTERNNSRAEDDRLDLLLESSPPRVLAWLDQRARLADGTRPKQPLMAAATVSSLVDSVIAPGGPERVQVTRKSCSVNAALRAGLMRDLAGATFLEIGRRMGISAAQATRLHQQHQRLVAEEADYRRLAERIIENGAASIASTFAPARRREC